MEYFFYCRDNPDVVDLRFKIVDKHWSFMDNYAEKMIARGPTLTESGEIATGSMHIVDLPDAESARVFAYEEPNYKAGVYSEVMVRRWRNDLARTMWEFKGDLENNRRYLIIGHGKQGSLAAEDSMSEAYRTFIAEQDRQGHLIVCGPLLSEDGSEWMGNALMVELPSRPMVDVMLSEDPYTKYGLYERVEVHRWRFGGRV
jgi:uncharacterized protein